MKSNFTDMNQEKLRQYIIQNPDDKDAFYQYIDRLKANSHHKMCSHSLPVSEIEKAVVHHIEAKKNIQ